MYNDELYHFGVKGMKWGHRKKYYNSDGSLNKLGQARQNYKTAKKEYNKSFDKAYNRAIAAYSPIKKHRQANDARWVDAANKAEASRNAKAEYKKAKIDDRDARVDAKNKEYIQSVQNKANRKLEKANRKGEKAEFNTYTKAMKKTGLPGSFNDIASRNRATGLYENIKTQKGKEYADRVQKKVEKQLYTQLAVSSAVAIGSAAASVYFATR